MNTHENIKAIRCFKGYSQEYIAHLLGMTQKNYSKYERGENKLTVELLEKIAAVFDMQAKDLLTAAAFDSPGTKQSAEIESRIGKLEELLSLLILMMKKVFGGGTLMALENNPNIKQAHPENYKF